MTWNSHDYNAGVHDQNANTHWANGNHVEYWNSLDAAQNSRMRAQWQRDDEAAAAARAATPWTPYQPPQIYNSPGTYTDGYYGGNSSPPLWKSWLPDTLASMRYVWRKFKGCFTGHDAYGKQIGIARRCGTFIFGVPASALYALFISSITFPFAILSGVMHLSFFLLKIAFIFVWNISLIALACGAVAWGGHQLKIWDARLPYDMALVVSKETGLDLEGAPFVKLSDNKPPKVVNPKTKAKDH